MNELNKVKKHKRKVTRDNLFYEVSKKIYDFKDIQAVRSFGGGILENGIDELDKYNEKQADLLQYILESNSKTKPRSKVDIDKNWIL